MSLRLVLFVASVFTLNTLCLAQYKVIITNLNNKKEFELKIRETFYFETSGTHVKMQGTLESITEKDITISGKKYKPEEILWIDAKGRRPKKHTGTISRIMLYFGGGLIGLSAYEYFEANDKKTGNNVIMVGGALCVGSFLFWALPRQPQYDFTSKYLMEIRAVEGKQ